MIVEYRTKSLEKTCTQAKVAIRAYGQEMAIRLQQRIKQIQSTDTVEMLLQFHIGRCHALHGDREGQYAMDLVHPYRLVFTRHGDVLQIARIEEIVDYH